MTPPKTCHSHILSSAKLERPSDHGTFMTSEYSPVNFYLHVNFESGSELHTQTSSPPRVFALLHTVPTSCLPPFLIEGNSPASTHQDPPNSSYGIGWQSHSARTPAACQQVELGWNLTSDEVTHLPDQAQGSLTEVLQTHFAKGHHFPCLTEKYLHCRHPNPLKSFCWTSNTQNQWHAWYQVQS